MKNELLEKLAEEIGGKILSSPPKNAVSVTDLMEKTGLSYAHCNHKLLAAERRGDLRRVTVRREDGRRIIYWIAAK